ncbi:ABC transporter permease (plasmid) [Rhizobium sp. RCAM05350]|uniref:ABC transporter permease n=1 Tax=Rhizobium sp. RCAM05350 TaxID=2895568 RepID=UPI002076AE8A|nr:ABC transporter permease [Rhizobium sp. RCAM05350]URK89561.1 ABC transporter permease [Rhizobium sp. RCAM05350]
MSRVVPKPPSELEVVIKNPQRPTMPQNINRVIKKHPMVASLVVLFASIVVFSFLNPRFLTAANMGLILQQVTVIAVLALGQALIVLTRGIDLSLGAITVLSSIAMASTAVYLNWSPPVAISLGIAAGVALGLINGLFVIGLRLPPFLATLATLSMYGALATVVTKGVTISATNMPPMLSWMGSPFVIGGLRLTYGCGVMLIMFAVVAYVMQFTQWGRHVYAVGDDPEASRLAGISVKHVLLSVYTVAGCIYGIGAWLLIGRLGAASPNAGVDYNLDAITAVVIGGLSLFGGRGQVIGALFGALIVGVFRNGLQLSGVQVQWQGLAIGALVVVAVTIDQRIRGTGAAR